VRLLLAELLLILRKYDLIIRSARKIKTDLRVRIRAGACGDISFIFLFMRKSTVNHQSLPIFGDLPNDSWTALITNLTDVHARLRENLAVTQQRTQLSTDVARTPAPTLSIGDKVFLRAEFIRTTRPSRKLADKYLGPFEIIGVAGPASFVLRLPDGMHHVHPVWHVSQLEPAHDAHFEGRTQPPPPPIKVFFSIKSKKEGEAKHEVAGILDSKLDCHWKEPLVYLVKWTGYEGTPDESSWEPAEHLQHAADLVHEFHCQHPDKPGPA
jgi:hypothetical protein